jgi:hypothetical protein
MQMQMTKSQLIEKINEQHSAAGGVDLVGRIHAASPTVAAIWS